MERSQMKRQWAGKVSSLHLFLYPQLLGSGFRMVWRCLLSVAPVCLRELCCTLLIAMSSRLLHSSQQGLLLVRLAHTSTIQNHTFSMVDPSTWNGLPFELCIFPRTLFIHSFILETYIAPLQDTTTQRHSMPSHGQRRRTSERCKICLSILSV